MQRLLPWRRRTLVVSGKEPHYAGLCYLGPVTVLDAHQCSKALRSSWRRHRESRGLTSVPASLRLKVNRVELSYGNGSPAKSQDFLLHRIISCEHSAASGLDSDQDDVPEGEERATEQLPDTLVAWTYRHQHKKARVQFKAHVLQFPSAKRAAEFQASLSGKLAEGLQEYRRERSQRATSRSRMVRTRSVDSALKAGRQHSTPLRRVTLSTAKHFRPSPTAAPTLHILNEDEEEDIEVEALNAQNGRRLSRLSLALVD